MVVGGDGTIGCVLGCLGELYRNSRELVPPVAIVPLGTCNDLSKIFWLDIKRTLQRAITGPISYLDSWHVVMQMPGGKVVDPPHSLKATKECFIDKVTSLSLFKSFFVFNQLSCVAIFACVDIDA